MKWKTKISTQKDGQLYIRGKKLTELIGKASFTESLFFLLQGRMPTLQEHEIFDMILVAPCEHGLEAPSAFVPRTVISTGNSMNAALAAGVLAVGDWHGGAIEQCAKLMQSDMTGEQIVREALAKKERVPGYGHKIYKENDPRSQAIFQKVDELRMTGNYIKKAKDIEIELEKQSGKKLPVNIDGAIAAVMSELNMPWQLGKAFFVLGRMPGMITHVFEEMIEEKPYRRLSAEDVEYQGKQPEA